MMTGGQAWKPRLAKVAPTSHSLDQQHLRGFLDQRVRDGVLRRAIDKWLKAGVLEDGAVVHKEGAHHREG